jgi:hypothetical protein
VDVNTTFFTSSIGVPKLVSVFHELLIPFTLNDAVESFANVSSTDTVPDCIPASNCEMSNVKPFSIESVSLMSLPLTDPSYA